MSLFQSLFNFIKIVLTSNERGGYCFDNVILGRILFGFNSDLSLSNLPVGFPFRKLNWE